MTKKWKKLLGVGILSTGVLATSLVASADTTSYYFNLAVNKSDISKRTLKAGGSNYEATFYVTPTYFDNDVRYHAASFYLDTKTQYGVDLTLTDDMLHQRQPGAYHITPPSGKYYYLQGHYDDAASSGPALYVEGRFTP